MDTQLGARQRRRTPTIHGRNGTPMCPGCQKAGGPFRSAPWGQGRSRACTFSLDHGRLGGSRALTGNLKQPWRPPARQVDAVTLSRVEEDLALAQVFDLDQSSLGEPAGDF